MSDDLKSVLISTVTDIISAQLDAQKEIHIHEIKVKVDIAKQECFAVYLERSFEFQKKILGDTLRVTADIEQKVRTSLFEITSAIFALPSLPEDDRRRILDLTEETFLRLSDDIGQALHDTASKARDRSID